MNIHNRLSNSPATGIALLALFFALGGSAFAVGERVQALTAAQQRCTNGAVRGVAMVTGDPKKGIANVPDTFTGAGAIFSRKFNCTGKATQVRRVDKGIFEVRFVGNAAPSAVANGLGPYSASAETIAPGTFRIAIYGFSGDTDDRSFVVVAV